MQSIIVYRNPLEAALWEGGFLFIAALFTVAFFLTFVISISILKYFKVSPWTQKGRLIHWAVIVGSFLLSFYIIWLYLEMFHS